jgi:hypothetical protein
VLASVCILHKRTKRTTIHLPADIEVRLERETLRGGSQGHYFAADLPRQVAVALSRQLVP